MRAANESFKDEQLKQIFLLLFNDLLIFEKSLNKKLIWKWLQKKHFLFTVLARELYFVILVN